MNKENKKVILAVIITAIFSFCIGVIADQIYNAADIVYTPENNSFEVNNIKDAIDYLYEQDQQYMKIRRDDLKSRVYYSNDGYRFSSGTLNINTTTKEIIIELVSDVVVQNRYATFEIDLKGLGINKINKYTYQDRYKPGDYKVYTATATPEKINVNIDTNYGSGTKYKVDMRFVINYE